MFGSGGRTVLYERSHARPAGPAWPGVRTGAASGRRSRRVSRARTRRSAWACRRRSGPVGPERRAACHRRRWRGRRSRPRGGTCRSRSARRSRCGVRGGMGCGRLPDGWGERRRRSRAVGRTASDRRNAATRGGGLEYRATTAQWHAERAARRPKPAKLATNPALRRYVQERLAGAVVAPDGGRGLWAGGALEGPPARAAEAPALGACLEPAADLEAAAARLPRR